MRSTPPCPEKETRIASFGRVTLHRQYQDRCRLAQRLLPELLSVDPQLGMRGTFGGAVLTVW